MRTLLWSVVLAAALSAGCSGGNPPVFPTSPSQVTTPAPAPAPFSFAEPHTSIAVGEVVSRRVGADGNPECVDLPGWHCHYFRLTAPSDGKLDVALTWALETQPNQPLDLSLTDSRGVAFWSNYGPGSQGKLLVPVNAGSTYQLTVWYTFTGVEFGLRSSLESN
jgi:hypothetical protein